MVVLLFAQAALPIREGWHKLVELVVFGATMALTWWWNRHNAAALDADRTLQELQRRSVDGRDGPLTEVQARYLLAQQRHPKDF